MEFKNGLKTGVSALALTAGFGMLAATAPAQAGSFSAPPQACLDNFTPGQDRTSFVTDSVTPIQGGGNRYEFTVCNTSDANAGQNQGGGTGFEFLAIRDWEIPFFGDSLLFPGDAGLGGGEAGNLAQIDNISSPEGWDFALEEIGVANSETGWDGIAEFQQDGDPFREFFDALYASRGRNNPFNAPDDDPDGTPGNGDENPGVITHVLHWFTNDCFPPFNEGSVCTDDEGAPIDTNFFDPIGPAFDFGEFDDEGIFMDARSGFGFDSPFSSGAAPYQASWVDLIINTGDPQIPALGSGGSPSPAGVNLLNVVPEPGTMALFGTGLAAMFLTGRRRRKKNDDT